MIDTRWNELRADFRNMEDENKQLHARVEKLEKRGRELQFEADQWMEINERLEGEREEKKSENDEVLEQRDAVIEEWRRMYHELQADKERLETPDMFWDASAPMFCESEDNACELFATIEDAVKYINNNSYFGEGKKEYRCKIVCAKQLPSKVWIFSSEGKAPIDAALPEQQEDKNDAWKEAIGCAPATPNSMSAEEAVRTGRGTVDHPEEAGT